MTVGRGAQAAVRTVLARHLHHHRQIHRAKRSASTHALTPETAIATTVARDQSSLLAPPARIAMIVARGVQAAVRRAQARLRCHHHPSLRVRLGASTRATTPVTAIAMTVERDQSTLPAPPAKTVRIVDRGPLAVAPTAQARHQRRRHRYHRVRRGASTRAPLLTTAIATTAVKVQSSLRALHARIAMTAVQGLQAAAPADLPRHRRPSLLAGPRA